MLIKYSHKVTWRKDIASDIFSDFGKNNKTKIQNLIKYAPASELSYKFEPLEVRHVKWFQKMYTDIISTKNNPLMQDILAATLNNKSSLFEYQIFYILQNNTLVGGAIFTMREHHLSIAFRVFTPNWPHEEHKCSPSLYAEYLLTKFALENNKKSITHGQDRNIFGQHSAIGVAIFKLSVGCKPFLPKTPTSSNIDLDIIENQCLILEYPKNGTEISKAYLLGDSTTAEKYAQIFAYPEQLTVKHYPTKTHSK